MSEHDEDTERDMNEDEREAFEKDIVQRRDREDDTAGPASDPEIRTRRKPEPSSVVAPIE